MLKKTPEEQAAAIVGGHSPLFGKRKGFPHTPSEKNPVRVKG